MIDPQLPESREQIGEIQRKFKAVAIERAKRAPFHARRLADIDPAKTDDPEHWARIPVLDKEELRNITPQQFAGDFCTIGEQPVAEYWRSGGSTGKPLFYPRTFEDLKFGFLSFARTFHMAGAGSGDRVHVSFPLGVHPVGHVYCRVAQQMGMGVTWAGAGASTPSAAQVELVRAMRPNLWLGMSSYGIHLANLAEAAGIDLAGSSVRTVMCTAEPLSDTKRAKIARMWGANVVDTFGMTEAGMMGCESEAGDGLHIWTDLFFIEVLDPDTLKPVAEGETGTLVVTPLRTNNATPFVRWNSGDVVTWRAAGKSGGRFGVFPVIRHAHRTTGFFKVRGININHADFEDFMFASREVNDFKCELVTEADREILRVSFEVARGAEPGPVRSTLEITIRDVFGVTPDLVVLDGGALAREAESAVKMPRFVDRRS